MSDTREQVGTPPVASGGAVGDIMASIGRLLGYYGIDVQGGNLAPSREVTQQLNAVADSITAAIRRAAEQGRREALAWAYEQAYPRGDFGITRADWDLGRTQYVVRGLAALADDEGRGNAKS